MKFFAFHISCFLLVVASLVGCKQPPAATITEARKDSTNVTTRDREVPTFIPGETVTVIKYIECDSITNKPKATTIESKGNKAFVKTTVDADGKLTSTGGCDSLTALLHAKDSIISHYKSYTRKEVKPVIIYKTRTIDWWARIIAILAIIYLISKLKKLIP